MNYRTCTKCNIEYEASPEFFNRMKTGKYGLRAVCRICCKKYNKKWYDNHIEYKSECGRQYHENNKERNNERNRQWHKDNKKHRNNCTKRWAKNNPDKRNAAAAKRRATKLNQTPQNADLEKIQFIYEVCSTMEGYHVDHIQPLSKGGLHHENNLQILEASLNQQKSDKWPLTKEEQIKYRGYRIAQSGVSYDKRWKII